MKLLAVEPFAGSAADLPRLLACGSVKLSRWKASPAAVEALALHRVDQMLRAPGARALSISEGQAVQGLAILQPLEWDSRVLDFPAARLEVVAAGPYAERVEVVDALVQVARAEARSLGITHVSVRVDAADDAAVHVFERHGFINVDAVLTFGAELDQITTASARSNIDIRAASFADATEVGDIAGASFKDGRFHTDPAIPSARAQQVYREWAVACVAGVAADYVAVASFNDRLAGFVACRLLRDTAVYFGRPTSTIALIATAPHARGQGVGPVLIGAARDWCRGQDVETLEVGTQLRNLTAARLYERCGFRLVASSFSFRVMLSCRMMIDA
jgi:dTDP-4-amino-4,6-dideoxy-D-galactose acyltransferase